jgi:hypothetical protein
LPLIPLSVLISSQSKSKELFNMLSSSKVRIFFLFLFALTQGVSAQTVRVIDNKGTIKELTAGLGIGFTNAGATIKVSSLYDGVTLLLNGSNQIYAANTTAYWNANKLQGIDISTTAPSITGQVLGYDGAKWTPVSPSAYAWLLTGNGAITVPAIPTTYGTTTLSSSSNWIGTIDANKDFIIGTNSIERLRVTSGGNIGIGTSSGNPINGNYLMTINPNATIGNGISMNLSGVSGNVYGLNISTGTSAANGILFTSTSTGKGFFGIGALINTPSPDNSNNVSGYIGYRNSGNKSYGVYGADLSSSTANTYAAFLQGRTVISSEAAPSSPLGVDLEIRNTSTSVVLPPPPATLSLRQSTSITTNANALANINFGDNYQTSPQAQIQAIRDAASSGASDLPTALTFSTTPDAPASATLTERMRISNAGNVGIGIANPAYKLDVAGDVNFTGALRVGATAAPGTSGQILQSNGSGAPNWVSPNSALTKASITSSTTGVTITGTNNVLSAGTIDIATASGTQQGLLSAANWNTFNSKEPAITAGTTAQYWRGDKTWQTLNTSVVPENTNLYYTDTRVRSAISLTTIGTSGAATYNNTTGVLNIPNYADGGITSLNGLTGLTQTFAIGTSGTNPNWTSATSIHTLNIPMASASISVTAGLISNTDWNTFNNKIGAVTALTPAAVLTSGTTATIQNTVAYWNANKLQGIDISTTPAPTDGQVLTYNDTKKQWEPKTNSGGSGSGWLLGGNTISSGQFLGTNNSEALVFKVNGQPSGLIGWDNSGSLQTNFGYKASTSAQFSTAIGAYSIAANAAVALGYQANASSEYSIAIGGAGIAGKTEATSSFATAIGSGAKAMAQHTTAIGGTASATGEKSTALGYGAITNSATNNYRFATALGSTANALAENATAVGFGASVSGKNSTAVGYGATTSQQNTLILGNTSGSGDATNVGIGTATPTNALHVKATANPLRLEGLQESTNSSDRGLVVTSTGEVKISAPSSSDFSGYISADVSVGSSITKITVDTELMDVSGEYDTSTGLFTPQSDGAYIFEMEISYKSPYYRNLYYGSDNSGGGPGSGNNRAVFGFVSSATSSWVSRFNFESSVDSRVNYCKGVVNLKSGQQYYFGIVSSSYSNTGTIEANTTGATGSGIGTYFRIQRIK